MSGPERAILGPDGRPVSAERVRMDKRLRFNPLVNWTPDKLTTQLAAWARGEIKDLAWVMEWLEQHDDMIATVAPKAKAAVSRHGYDVVLRDEIDDTERGLAEDQRGRLQEFYDGVEVGHAVDGDLHGGMRLLMSQVMDGYGKGWSAHHIVWHPGATLRAELVHVPLWFWEATEGRLRFLPHYSAYRGVDREQLGGESAWLIARGRGVMQACAIASMFKRIPLQDWLTYCDRHGMPAFLGKTSSKKGQTGWNELFDAVSNIGSEFGAVVNTGDTIEVLDLTTRGELPYEALIDRMDRATVMLWRGGDLSTISRSDGVGSNPQQEESDALDADNAAWVGETIDRQLSRRVLDYYFGESAPQLAELRLRTKTRDNIDQDLKVIQAFSELDVRISKPWALNKFGVVEADGDEEALGGDQAAEPEPSPAPPVDAANARDESTNPDQITMRLQDVLARVLKVRAEMLEPATPILAELAERAGGEDSEPTSEEMLEVAERLADELPEFVRDEDIERMADELETALSAEMIGGVREQIKTDNPDDDHE